MTTAIPAFKDNYIWCLDDHERGVATVVDPGEAQPVIDHLEASGLELGTILITHHHRDHTGGIAALKARWPMVVVHGPMAEAIPDCDQGLNQGDSVMLAGFPEPMAVIDVPGHTRGHIAYYGNGLLFCGDALFTGGCGAIFEGTPAQMFESLERLAALPPRTRVYCAHEYTLENLAFALQVEPNSAALQQRMDRARALRAEGRPTVPSTLEEELATNPFLRSHEATVRTAAEAWCGRELKSPMTVFAAVRAWKDSLD